MTEAEKGLAACGYGTLHGTNSTEKIIADSKPCVNHGQAVAPSSATEIAKSPDILDLFIGAVQRLGTVGDEAAYKLLFLVLTSRVFDEIASIFVQGPSSAGKSFAITQTVRFFPESAYYFATAMSEKALAYIEEPLKHRILVIAEAAGLTGTTFQYFLRTLISEGRIDYTTVDSNGGRDPLAARRIRVEGPCGVILSTTEARLEPEIETRGFTIQVDDAKAQTHRILEVSAAHAAGAQDKVGISQAEEKAWVGFQEQLKDGPTDVIVPFGPLLASRMPDSPVRLRRDFKRILILIRAHALLHRETRQKDSEGRIIATLEDYDQVAELLRGPISEAAGAAVPKNVRRVVKGVKQLLENQQRGSVRGADLAAHLGIDTGTCSRNIRQAVEVGYLKNDESRSRQPSKLRLGEPLPDSVSILPPASELSDSDWRIGANPEGGGQPEE